METSEETIAERLKRLRKERGLSQRELASPGVTAVYICRIEKRQRQPSVTVIRKLAEKLGVSAEYLETGKESYPLETYSDEQLIQELEGRGWDPLAGYLIQDLVQVLRRRLPNEKYLEIRIRIRGEGQR